MDKKNEKHVLDARRQGTIPLSARRNWPR